LKLNDGNEVINVTIIQINTTFIRLFNYWFTALRRGNLF